MTRRYILSAWERARVQYEVLADSPDEARAMYERGDVGRMLIDEHDDGEIVDVTDVTGRGLHPDAVALGSARLAHDVARIYDVLP